MVRNPSELARLEEEREHILHNLAGQSKGVKETMLRELRSIERQLGIDSKPYNG